MSRFWSSPLANVVNKERVPSRYASHKLCSAHVLALERPVHKSLSERPLCGRVLSSVRYQRDSVANSARLRGPSTDCRYRLFQTTDPCP